MTEKIKQFLEFRKQFTPREWNQLEREVKVQFRKKADELTLDDQDIKEIESRYEKVENFLNPDHYFDNEKIAKALDVFSETMHPRNSQDSQTLKKL